MFDHVLNEKVLNGIAEKILTIYKTSVNDRQITILEKQINSINLKLDNLSKNYIQSTNEEILKRLDQQANDLTELKNTLSAEKQKLVLLSGVRHSKEDIKSYLKMFMAQEDNVEFKKRLVNIFIKAIYVFVDNIQIYFNLPDDKPINFSDVRKTNGSSFTTSGSL